MACGCSPLTLSQTCCFPMVNILLLGCKYVCGWNRLVLCSRRVLADWNKPVFVRSEPYMDHRCSLCRRSHWQTRINTTGMRPEHSGTSLNAQNECALRSTREIQQDASNYYNDHRCAHNMSKMFRSYMLNWKQTYRVTIKYRVAF